MNTITVTDCGHDADQTTECEHFVLCLDCRAEGCAKCRRIARDEIGATW